MRGCSVLHVGGPPSPQPSRLSRSRRPPRGAEPLLRSRCWPGRLAARHYRTKISKELGAYPASSMADPTLLTTPPDVQARRADHARQPLARRRDGRREGRSASGRARASSSSTPSSSASSTSSRSRRARTCRASRRPSTRRSTRSCSARPFKAETLATHIAERVRERQEALRAEVTVAARYPEHKPAPVVGHADAGDLHAVRLGGRLRARHAPARRRAGAGHDGVPVRAGDGRRRARASGSPRTASPTTRSSACFDAVPVATHNQRGLGTLWVGCPEGCDDDDRGGAAARRSSRSR